MTKHDDVWKEDSAAILANEIRRALTRSAGQRTQADIAKVGRLIDQRINESYARALAAAVAEAAKS